MYTTILIGIIQRNETIELQLVGKSFLNRVSCYLRDLGIHNEIFAMPYFVKLISFTVWVDFLQVPLEEKLQR